MASIRRDIPIDAQADTVWDAVRDVGACHTRLTPGVLTDARLDGDTREVTFAAGLTVHELIVDIDDDARRVAYSVLDGPFTHHHASMQVVPNDSGASRIVWITDLLPDDAVALVAPLMDEGADAMRRTLGG